MIANQRVEALKAWAIASSTAASMTGKLCNLVHRLKTDCGIIPTDRRARVESRMVRDGVGRFRSPGQGAGREGGRREGLRRAEVRGVP